jgi:hypothetical protein
MAKKFKHAELVKEINFFMSGKKHMMVELATNRYKGGESTLNLVCEVDKEGYMVEIAEAKLTYDEEGYIKEYTPFASAIFNEKRATLPKHEDFTREQVRTIMMDLHMMNTFLEYLLGEPKPPLKRIVKKQ